MKNFKEALQTYSELHWWNMGSKTLSFKGSLKDLLNNQKISYTKKKHQSYNDVYVYHFKNSFGISFKATGTIFDFPFYAKQFIQMELVRMGDKSKLYVQNVCRPTVTVNF
jgi:hypothetical protein